MAAPLGVRIRIDFHLAPYLDNNAKANQMLQLKDEGAAQAVLLGAKTKRVPAVIEGCVVDRRLA